MDNRYSFRVTEKQDKLIQRAFKKSGAMSMSEFIRGIIIKAAKREESKWARKRTKQ